MCLRWPFPPACQRKGNHETQRAVAMPFSPCLSRKKAIMGLGMRLRLAMAFSPCLSRKSPSWDLLCTRDGLSPLPVEEKGSIVANAVCPGSLFPLPQGKNVNRGHRNVSAKCTGPKLTDSIPSPRLYKECVSRTQEEAIRLDKSCNSKASPAAAGRACR